MSLKMECHKKWNVTKTAIFLKTDSHLKWSVTKKGISPKM